MKVSRNITKTPAGTYRVRICRAYFDHPIQLTFLTLLSAEQYRDYEELRYPIRSPHHHPKKPRCPHCGQALKH